MKMLHIKITRDDETVIDCDTNGIVAVVNQENTIAALSELNGITGGDALCMVDGLDELKDRMLQEHPELGLLRKLKALLKDKEDKETEKESEKDEPKPSGLEALLDILTSDN
jgi:hypothetical protein